MKLYSPDITKPTEVNYYWHEKVLVEPMPKPKQGEWIHDRLEADGAKLPDLFLPLCQCSECAIYVQYESNYCPNCGARMEGVDDDI